MRPRIIAAYTTMLALAACGGQQAASQPPPLPSAAPPPVASAPPPAESAPPPPPKPSLAELVPQTLKGIDEAFNAHDAKKIAAYYTDDAVLEAYGFGEAHGKDELSQEMQRVFDLVGDLKAAPTRLFTKGNVAVEEVAWAGTMTGDFMGIKATRKPLGEVRLVVMRFDDDGLVKAEHVYGDGAGLVAQMKGMRVAPPVPVLPTNPPELHVAKGTPDEDKLADWARAFDAAFDEDDPKAVLADMADDADYWANVRGTPAVKGKKALTRELTTWFKAFPDQKWTVTDAWGIDGFAIIEHAMSGTQKGPLGPIVASNKPVSAWHWADIIQPNGERKVQHGWGFANLAEMMRETGALKAPSDKASAGAASVGAAKGSSDKSAPGKQPKTDAGHGADKK